MARSYVARELVRLGGQPVWREGVVTDNGNVILDVHHLSLTDPEAIRDHGQPDRRRRHGRIVRTPGRRRAARGERRGIETIIPRDPSR